MKATSAWDNFFANAVRKIFVPGTRILDIGSGLRIDQSRGNRVDPTRAWIKPLLKDVTYQILDPISTYHPDIVGDVMQLSLPNETYDAVICLAVLEHVPRPWDAVKEMYRVLKPGGFLFLYIPFLSPYHAMPGYYGDYFRFTEDGIRSLCGDFSDLELAAVRGPIETLAHLIPGRQHSLRRITRWLDSLRRSSGKQVSGYYMLARRPIEGVLIESS